MRRLAILILSAFLGYSCATVRVTQEYDAEVKNQEIPEGKALVYILRPSTYGYAAYRHVYCEYQYLGTLGIKSYICREFDPGEYTFIVTDNYPINETVTLTLEPDKEYFLKMVVKHLTTVSRNAFSLEEIPADREKSSIRKCTLTSIPPYITVLTSLSPNTLSGTFVKFDDNYLYLNQAGNTLKINIQSIITISNNSTKTDDPIFLKNENDYLYMLGFIWPGSKEEFKRFNASRNKYWDLYRIYDADFNPVPFFNPLKDIVEINNANDFPYK